jgi:hypothetical protein
MSLWGSDIFGATRERNQNEEWIRKQSLSKQGQEEPIPLSEKEQKTVNLWVKISLVIIMLFVVVWFSLH